MNHGYKVEYVSRPSNYSNSRTVVYQSNYNTQMHVSFYTYTADYPFCPDDQYTVAKFRVIAKATGETVNS